MISQSFQEKSTLITEGPDDNFDFLEQLVKSNEN